MPMHMDPTKAKEATRATERMGLMGAMLFMVWWGTLRNRGALQGWLSPWQSPHSPPGFSAKKVSDSNQLRCINVDGWYFSGQPQWLFMEVVGLAVNTGTSFPPPNKEEDDEDKDHPVSPLLPSSSFIKASSSQTARLPQRDWQSIPQSWGTYKAYLKIEAHKNYTSNPQKGGAPGLILISILNTPILNWLIVKANQSILNPKLLKLCRNLWSTTPRMWA